MAEKHINKCSISLVIRDMQIKITPRFHLTPVRMAKIKNSGDSRCWRGCGERGTLRHCWWDCRLVQPLWKSVWRFLRKLDIVLPEDPAIYYSWAYTQMFQHVIRTHAFYNSYSYTLKLVRWFLIKLNIVLPEDPAIPLLGISTSGNIPRRCSNM